MGSDQKNQSEIELLQRIATRDKVAFETLYSVYYPQLTRYLTRLLRRPETVEEVINDTMFVVWQKAFQFEGRSKVSTWITGIAYLKGIKALDKINHTPENHASPLSDIEEIEERENLLRKLRLEEWLLSGLDRISVEQRSVVELTYFGGYSYQEIANIMQCPVNTVKTRMFHARRRLAKLLPLLREQIPEGMSFNQVLEELDGESNEDK